MKILSTKVLGFQRALHFSHAYYYAELNLSRSVVYLGRWRARTCLTLIWPLLDFHICHRPHQRKGRTIDVFKTQLVLPTTKCCRSWGCWLDSFPSFFTLSVVLPFHHSSSQICIPSFLFSGISRLEKVIQVDESIFIFKRDRLWYSGREKGCCIQLKKSTLEHNV